MNMKYTPLILAVAIAAIIGSAFVANATLTAAVYAQSQIPAQTGFQNFGSQGQCMQKWGKALLMHRGLPPLGRLNQTSSLTVSNITAQNTVNAYISKLTAGTATSRGSLWMVRILYDTNVYAMTVPVGKINTPTAADALSSVQASLKSWTAGTPNRVGGSWVVPIIASNGSSTFPVGHVIVDGATGNIINGFPMLRFPMPPR